MFTDHYDNMVEQVNIEPPASLATLVVTTPSNGTVISNGSINCGGTCTEELVSGWPVTLIAIPDLGYEFVSWGGDCSGTRNPLNLTFTTNMTCSATFETSSTTHTLSVTTHNNGSVTTNGVIDCGKTCTEELLSDSPVTFTPVPGSGYQFVSWGDDCSGTGVGSSKINLGLLIPRLRAFILNLMALSFERRGLFGKIGVPNGTFWRCFWLIFIILSSVLINIYF